MPHTQQNSISLSTDNKARQKARMVQSDAWIP